LALAVAFAGGWGCCNGVSMAGGVVQMLITAAYRIGSKQDADNKPSYAFGSVTNTTLRDIRCLCCMESAVSVVQLFRRIYVEDQQ
jgi:predicted phage tail protein